MSIDKKIYTSAKPRAMQTASTAAHGELTKQDVSDALSLPKWSRVRTGDIGTFEWYIDTLKNNISALRYLGLQVDDNGKIYKEDIQWADANKKAQTIKKIYLSDDEIYAIVKESWGEVYRHDKDQKKRIALGIYPRKVQDTYAASGVSQSDFAVGLMKGAYEEKWISPLDICEWYMTKFLQIISRMRKQDENITFSLVSYRHGKRNKTSGDSEIEDTWLTDEWLEQAQKLGERLKALEQTDVVKNAQHHVEVSTHGWLNESLLAVIMDYADIPQHWKESQMDLGEEIHYLFSSKGLLITYRGETKEVPYAQIIQKVKETSQDKKIHIYADKLFPDAK